MKNVEGEITEYGFNWGAAEVTRMFSDGRHGWVTIGVKTPKHDIQIYVTKTGKVRIHDADGEWLPKAKGAARKRPARKKAK